MAWTPEDIKLRSLADKSETGNDENLRLRSGADREGVTGWTGKIKGVTNPSKVNGIAVANISKINGV